MVYERIDVETQRHVIHWPAVEPDNADEDTIVLTSQSLPVGLLASCRLVYAEATPYLRPKLALLHDRDRFRLTVDVECLGVFVQFYHCLTRVIAKREYCGTTYSLPRSFELGPGWDYLETRLISKGSVLYEEIDTFTAKCAELGLRCHPKRLTLAVRFPQAWSVTKRGRCLQDVRREDLWLAHYHILRAGGARESNVQMIVEEEK
jgi:hypothetical protein